jgi:hypothetical protein
VSDDTATTLGRVRRAVLHAAEQANAERATCRSGAERQAYSLGVKSMRDVLLDLTDADTPAANPGDRLLDDVRAFCWGRCVYGTEEEPGGHPECIRCELHRYTIVALEQGTKES